METSAQREPRPTASATEARDRRIAVVAIVLLLIGMPIGYLPGSTGDVIGLIVLSLVDIVLIAAALAWFIPSERAAGRAGRTALIMGIISVLSVLVFWTGLPFALGATALALGLGAREAPADAGKATTAAVLGGLAILASFVALLVG